MYHIFFIHSSNSISSKELASLFLADNENYVTEHIYLFSLADRKLRDKCKPQLE